jgi:ADP-ribosylglycohydrolase
VKAIPPNAVEAGGDMDTTAAIVGGIVAAYTGRTDNGIPALWLDNREPLPECLRSGAIMSAVGR